MKKTIYFPIILCNVGQTWGARADSSWINLFNEQTGFEHWYSYVGSNSQPPYSTNVNGVRNDSPGDGAFVADGDMITHNINTSDNVIEFGYLATKDTYSRYHFKVDYRFEGSCDRNFECLNSGILYHLQNDYLWPTSIECNMYTGWPTALSGIGEDGSMSYGSVSDGYENTGNNRNLVAALGGSYNGNPPGGITTVGDWHTMEVIVEGSEKSVHYLNGVEAGTLEEFRFGGQPVESGNVALQIEGASISFRNINIRHLDSLKFWGCTDEASTGFDSEATHDDTTCVYTGCADSDSPEYFCNENPNAFPCRELNGYSASHITEDGTCALGVTHRPENLNGVSINPMVVSGDPSLTYILEIRNIEGDMISREEFQGTHYLSLRENGIYFVSVVRGLARKTARVLNF